MRILVAQSPNVVTPSALPAVGIVRWLAPTPAISIVVKATFSFAGEGEEMVLSESQDPLVSSDLSAEGTLQDASDFVPVKAMVDVLLFGDAYSVWGRTSRFGAHLVIGSVSRHFVIMTSEQAFQVPLQTDDLRDWDGDSKTLAVGPLRQVQVDQNLFHEPGFDFLTYNSACPQQQSTPISSTETIHLVGLSPRGERRITLPGLKPRVLVTWAEWSNSEVDVICDTVRIDTRREQCSLVWRGHVDLPVPNAIDRVTVALEQAGVKRDWYLILQSLGRGTFSFAAEDGHLSTLPIEGTDEPELIEMARREALELEDGPEPTISLEQYAEISAELAEQREGRMDVLRRYKLDEDSWLIEERGWLERMANGAMAGDGTLAVRYGELFVEAQDRLAAPAELERTMDDYVELVVAMEEGDEPMKVLEGFKMKMAEWMRLDRRFTNAAREDPKLAEELRRRVAIRRQSRL